MSGLLIYSRFEAERNAFSVEQYKKHLDISLMFEEEIDFSGPADFVINRTNNFGIAKEFEKRGIRVFNPSSLTRLANDKQKCYEFMRDNGIEILPVDYKTPPLVMKPIDGKGGKDVIFIKDGVPPEKGATFTKSRLPILEKICVSGSSAAKSSPRCCARAKPISAPTSASAGAQLPTHFLKMKLPL